jgi:hypothetical protein
LRTSNRIRNAVEREGAAYYVRLILLSFAATVAITRLYLTLTGFPQIGNRTLHISHLLWGGLALFISAILMTIYANRWVYTLGSILAGCGVGLFIDEVGKFITRTNDYFFPPAAPIIYILFLLILLLYLEVRHPPKRDARSELYRVFDTLQEVLDRDLEAHERADLKSRLDRIVDLNEEPDLTRLAKDLLHFLDSKSVMLVPHQINWLERASEKWEIFEDRWLTLTRRKAIVIAGLVALGLWSMLDLILLIPGISSALHIQTQLTSLTQTHLIIGPKSLTFYLSGVAIKAVCGLAMLSAAGLLIADKNKLGINTGYIGLLMCISVASLIEFYFDQFSTIIPAIIEFGLLIILLEYRRRYASMTDRKKEKRQSMRIVNQ